MIGDPKVASSSSSLAWVVRANAHGLKLERADLQLERCRTAVCSPSCFRHCPHSGAAVKWTPLVSFWDWPCTLRHLLNGSSAVHQGRYTCRHNGVLTIIQRRLIAVWTANATQKAIRTQRTVQRYITFVPPGHCGALTSRLSSRRPLMNQNILLQATDCDYRFDLGSGPLHFPTEVAATTLHPDFVIYSRTKKIMIMQELTIPLEDRPKPRAYPKDVEIPPPPPTPALPASMRRMASQPKSLLLK